MRLQYLRHVALIDALRGRDNPALPGLVEDPVNPTTGTMPLSIRLPGPTDSSGRALKSGLKSRAQSAQSGHADSKSFERWDAT